MIQITPQMRILLSVKAVDFRKGIDGLAGICRHILGTDPFSGCVFVFRNHQATAIKGITEETARMLTKKPSESKFPYRI